MNHTTEVCVQCCDTGWLLRRCPGASCGRVHRHAPHAFATACACRRQNPDNQRRRSAAATERRAAGTVLADIARSLAALAGRRGEPAA